MGKPDAEIKALYPVENLLTTQGQKVPKYAKVQR